MSSLETIPTTQLKLVCSDIDGTIVNNDHHAIPEFSPLMQRLTDEVPVALVSARPPEGIYSVARDYGITGAISSFSGAYVLDEEGRELFSKTMTLECACEIKDFLTAEFPQIALGVYAYNTWIVDDPTNPRVRTEASFVKWEPKVSNDVKGTFDERGVHKFLLMGELTQLLAAQKELKARFPEVEAVRSNDFLCEVMTKGVSKAHAITVLSEHYGIDRAHIAAFGDGPNDIEMLECVDMSFAMANAEESVKDAAQYLCPWSNLEGGVAKMALQLLGIDYHNLCD